MEEKNIKNLNFSENTLSFMSLGEMNDITNKPMTKDNVNREQLETWLKDPQSNAENLRQLSDFFYASNGIYSNVVDTFTNLPTLDNIIVPTKTTLEKKSDKSYDKYYSNIDTFYDSIEPKITIRNMLRSVALYGGYVGVKRQEGSEYWIQTLPLDYCRIRSRIGSEYEIEFNFKYFDKFYDEEDLKFVWNQFPKEFKKLYNRYKSDKKSRTPEWQMLDYKETWVIKLLDDNTEFVPMFTGMFEPIVNHEEYKDITLKGEKINIYKLLTQKIPTDPKTGDILLPKEVAEAYHKAVKSILPEGVDLATTPMSINDVPFQDSKEKKEDLLNKSERGVFIASSMSSGMFANEGGNTGLQLNVEIVTANIYAVLEKIESLFSKKFKYIVTSKNYTFKLKLFRVTNLNVKDNFEMAFKMLSVGGSLNHLSSVLGFDADGYNTLLEIENELKVKDNLVIPQSIYTQNNSQDNSNSENEGGKPKKNEKDLTSDGVETRNKTVGNEKLDNQGK